MDFSDKQLIGFVQRIFVIMGFLQKIFIKPIFRMSTFPLHKSPALPQHFLPGPMTL